MWLLFAFLSAAMLGFYDVFKKQSLRSNAVLPVLFLNTLLCSLIFLPLTLLSGITIAPDSLLYIPPTTWAEQRFIIIKACIVLSSWLAGYFAIKHLPLTIVGPINATRPVMVLLGAMLVYGERLNMWQWAGVSLAIISFFLLSRSSRKEGIRFSHNRWIVCLVAAAILGATSGLYDKWLLAPTEVGGAGLPRMTVQAYYNFYQCLLMLTMLLVLWLPHRRQSPFHWHWAIPFISIFLTIADLVYFYALSHSDAMISVVSMVRRGSVIVSFAFGAIVLREKNLRSKTFDVLLVLISMILLYIGSH